jgi:ATP-dependent phosphofructokinase / diphosphate-dependent phosphofructokinase
MVGLRGTQITDVPLADAIGTLKTVGPELYEQARVFFS